MKKAVMFSFMFGFAISLLINPFIKPAHAEVTLAQVLEKQDLILAKLEEIKAELAIIKVRASLKS